MTKLKQAIEAILFISGNPVSLSELANVLKTEEGEVAEALSQLQTEFAERGLVITESNKSYQMATNPEVSAVIKDYLQAQLREKLTEAAIETLSIITYKQPITKTEIEAIRGVNCQYILKLLLQRGLVEKSASSDTRVNVYQTTHEFLNHLGLKNLQELPDFEEITAKMERPEDEV